MAHDPRDRRNALDIFTYINVNCSPRNQLPHEQWPQGIRKLINDYFHFFKTYITTEIYIKKAEIRRNTRILDIPKRKMYSRLTGEIMFQENQGLIAKITKDHHQLVEFLRDEERRAHQLYEEQLEKIKDVIQDDQVDTITAWLCPREEEMSRATKQVLQMLTQAPDDFVQTRTYAQAVRGNDTQRPNQYSPRNQRQQHQQQQQPRQQHQPRQQNRQQQNRQNRQQQQQQQQYPHQQQHQQQRHQQQQQQQQRRQQQRHTEPEQQPQQQQQQQQLQELFNVVQSLVAEVREIKAANMRSASRSLPGQNTRQNDPYLSSLICPPSEDGTISPRKRDRTNYIPETQNIQLSQPRFPIPPSSDY
jgi:hypothetical protein